MSDSLTLKENIRKGLIDSYRHRITEGHSCAICRDSQLPLANHALEAYLEDDQKIPEGFVLFSAASSWSRARGSYPVCTSCAPPCKKCGLPITTEKVLKFAHENDATHGQGYCQHMQFGQFLTMLFKRLFRLGRFSSAKTDVPPTTPRSTSHSPKQATDRTLKSKGVPKEELSIEAVKAIADKHLPAKNMLDNDNFVGVAQQLSYFGITEENELEQLVLEQKDFMKDEDEKAIAESLEPFREQRQHELYKTGDAELRKITDAGIDRLEGGAFYSWSGLLGIAMKGRFGEEATKEYVDKYVFPRRTRSDEKSGH